MVLDTSAVIAVTREEPGFEALAELMLVSNPIIAAPTAVECAMVLSKDVGDKAWAALGEILRRLGAETVSFSPEMAERATDAFLKFGKGRHPARLNFGDCISYSLAISTGRPLLYVGSDFDLTDVKRAR